ncbi:MAG TPA: glycosyl transferase, partial [Nitrososphaera sp.]|nr:glycosyl transferase [Nitrososphaera sp.]
NAAKRQQFRWAKGSIQVALKLLSDVMFNRKAPVDTKMQAFIQLTRHTANPLFLVQFLIFPMLLGMEYELYTVGWVPFISVVMYVLMGPGGYLIVINQVWNGNPEKLREKVRQFFFLMFFASGISVNNTVAVFDAVFGKKNEFLRTPKFGIVNKGDDWKHKEYVLPFTKTTLLEIFFAIYGCMAVFITLASGNVAFAPMLIVPTVGFIYVAYLSIVHSSFRKKKAQPLRGTYAPAIAAGKRAISGGTAIAAASVTQARSLRQNAVLVGMLAFLVAGAAVAYYGYQSTMHPINQAVGYISRAETAQTPEQLAEYVKLTQELTRDDGNPVWLFPTARTDFAHIQSNLDSMLMRAESTSEMIPHSEQYNMALRDMHQSAYVIKLSLLEAIPYMYISLTNLVAGGLWVAAVIAIFGATRRARTRVQLKVEGQIP